MRSRSFDEFLIGDLDARRKYVALLLDNVKSRIDNMNIHVGNLDAPLSRGEPIAALFAESYARAKEDCSDILAILAALANQSDFGKPIEEIVAARRAREARQRRGRAKSRAGRPPRYLAVIDDILTDLRNRAMTREQLEAMPPHRLADRYRVAPGTAKKALDAIKKIGRPPGLSETAKNSVVEYPTSKPRGNPS